MMRSVRCMSHWLRRPNRRGGHKFKKPYTSSGGDMEDTEKTGGTRYSKGKAVQNWLPWRGMEQIMGFRKEEDLSVEDARSDATASDALEWAFRELLEVMGNPLVEDDVGNLKVAKAAYWIAAILHAHEARETVQDVMDAGVVPVLATNAVARVSEYGADKYAPLDWQEGQSFSTLLSSAMRHVRDAIAYGVYSVNNLDGDCLHLAHALWNLLCLLDFVEQGRAEELDDVTPWRGVTASRADKVRKMAGTLGVDPVDVLRWGNVEFVADIEIFVPEDWSVSSGYYAYNGSHDPMEADGSACDDAARRV